MARLFNHSGEPIVFHSGDRSLFKIDCDALTPQDCDAIGHLMGPQLGPFGSVESVPSTSGVPGWLAGAFQQYAKPGHWPLIVDDVLTTGGAIEEQRDGRAAHGFVIFSRISSPPWWVTPLLIVNPNVVTLL